MVESRDLISAWADICQIDAYTLLRQHGVSHELATAVAEVWCEFIRQCKQHLSLGTFTQGRHPTKPEMLDAFIHLPVFLRVGVELLIFVLSLQANLIPADDVREKLIDMMSELSDAQA
jgi:hypothetical protein